MDFSKRRSGMYYFIKDETNTIHQYPVPKRCTAVYEREQLRDTIIHGVNECPYCMREWPDKKE